MVRRVALVSSSETSVLSRAIRHSVPEDAILHSHCRENLKSYIGINTDGFVPVMMMMIIIIIIINTGGEWRASGIFPLYVD
jgi:hypothetical protein